MTPRLSEVQQIYVSINFWILFRRLFWGVLCAAQHATGQVAQSRGHSSSCVASRSMDSNTQIYVLGLTYLYINGFIQIKKIVKNTLECLVILNLLVIL